MAGPVTTSPPAKTPGTFVAKVTGSTSKLFHLLMAMPLSFGTKARSAAWPMAGMMAVAGDREFRTLDLHGAAAAAGIGLAQFHPDALDPRDLPVLADDAVRGDEELHLDALFQGLLDLLGSGGHLGAGAAVEDEDLFRTRADGRPDGIHRDVPAADDGDAVAEGDLLAQVDPLQVIDPVDDPLELLAGDVELAARGPSRSR